MKLLGSPKVLAAKGFALAAMASASIAGAPAFAATQGSMGSTSTGTVSITATVPNRALITSLADVSFANADPSAAVSNSQGPCVWSNTATRKYTITASGSGTAGAFTLTDGTVVVPYSVSWANSANASSPSALTAGTATAALVASATNISCSAGVDSTLKVGIAASDLQNMVATNSYQGTLTLVVTPQ